MQVKAWKRINYVVEAVNLLEGCADSHETISGHLRSSLTPTVLERISVSERIVKMAQSDFAADAETIRRYFKQLPKLNFTLADAVLLCRHMAGTGKPEDIRAYIGEMDEKERAERFVNLQLVEEEGVKDGGTAAVEDWIRRIDTDDGTKWRLLSAFLYREGCLDEIIPLLNRAQALLEQTRKMWQPLVDDFECFWREKLEMRDVLEDIKIYTGVDLAETLNDGCLFICPNIISFNSIKIHIFDGLDEKSFYIGILFGDDFYLEPAKENNMDEDELIAALKLLGDKSKFEILRIVKDEGTYGAQLAKQMGLTTATISHHVNALLNRRLVQMETMEKKVYFRLDKEKMREIIARLEAEFL